VSKTTSRPAHRLATGLALSCIILASGASSASAAFSGDYDATDPAQKAQYDAALVVATKAYEYAVPVLNMERTFKTSTSPTVNNGRGGGPVNQFSHFEKLADAKDRTVVAPNSDTLYSMAWLDLSKTPQVIHSNSTTKRFHVFELLDPWEENFKNIGPSDKAIPDGNNVITGPNFKGKIPSGLRQIRSPYNRVWVIGRTYVVDKADLKAARKVMASYKIVPLNQWRGDSSPDTYTQPPPKVIRRATVEAHIPGTGPGEDAATFFDAAGDQLKLYKPPKRDAPILAQIKALGIGIGLHPTKTAKLSGAQLQAMRDAVTQGPGKLQGQFFADYIAGFTAHNGWIVVKTGTYATNYNRRAIVDRVGLGAPTPELAMYPLALLDSNRGILTGSKRYVAHFSAKTARPPVKFFWSMTLYDSDSFLVDNPLDRYLVNDRSRLRYNSDGSLDIYLQPNAPANSAQRANWLPTPSAAAKTQGFRLIVRLYGLSQAGINGATDGTGWQGPSILPCDDGTAASHGVACAG